MHKALFALLVFAPSLVSAHGSENIVPAPVPVSMAVLTGVLTILVTVFFSLYRSMPELVSRYCIRISHNFGYMLSVIWIAALGIGVLTHTLTDVWWLGMMAVGLVLCAIVSLSALFPRELYGSLGFSIAPLVLIILYYGEFYIPAFQTHEGLEYVLGLYLCFIIVGVCIAGFSFLKHDVITRTVLALGMSAPFYVRTRAHKIPDFADQLIISTIIIATSFDGLIHSDYWKWVHEMISLSEENIFVSGLLFMGAIALFNVTYFITIALMRDDVRAEGEYTVMRLATRFIPAFAPIAVGYCIAHNLTRIPFLFNESIIAYTWGLQLLCIIIGHVWSVLVSHEIAAGVFGDTPRTRRSQVSMTVYMVIITTISILMLQAPL